MTGGASSSSSMFAQLVMPLSFMLLSRKVIGTITREKESGIKEYLFINGCKPLPYHLSTIISEGILALFVKIFSNDILDIFDNAACNCHQIRVLFEL